MSYESPRPESFTWELGSEEIYIPLPEDPDDLDNSWLDMFNTAYGEGRVSTQVHVLDYLCQAVNPNGHLGTGNKSFYPLRFGVEGDEPMLIEGVVSRMATLQDYGPGGYFRPYLGLIRIKEAETGAPMFIHPEQEFLVPVEYFGELTLNPIPKYPQRWG